MGSSWIGFSFFFFFLFALIPASIAINQRQGGRRLGDRKSWKQKGREWAMTAWSAGVSQLILLFLLMWLSPRRGNCCHFNAARKERKNAAYFQRESLKAWEFKNKLFITSFGWTVVEHYDNQLNYKKSF